MLRFFWVLLALLLLLNLEFMLPAKPVALFDVSRSVRWVFPQEDLRNLEEELKRVGFDVRRFGTDTSTDLYSALKDAHTPLLLISDGFHNAPSDPLSVAYEKEVYVLIYPPLMDVMDVPKRVKAVRLKTPATEGEVVGMRVELTSAERDTVSLVYGGDTLREVAGMTAEFEFRAREGDALLLSSGDTVGFKIFTRKPKGIGVLAWTPLPVVRFIRWHVPDAVFIFVRDSIPETDFSFAVYVDPPREVINPSKPALYVLGGRSGFKRVAGRFYLRGDVPPIREVFLPPYRFDEVYERVGDMPLVASKGNALFVLSPDIWKVWLADPLSYERFLGYLSGFLIRDYEIYLERPVYNLMDRIRLHVFPTFPMEISVDGGKPVRITSLYTYERIAHRGDSVITVGVFKRGALIARESLRFSLREVYAEDVYLGVDTHLLKTLARLSGGGVFRSPQEAYEVLSRRGRLFSLSSLWPLFLMAVLLAWTEWFIRRSRGMV